MDDDSVVGSFSAQMVVWARSDRRPGTRLGGTGSLQPRLRLRLPQPKIYISIGKRERPSLQSRPLHDFHWPRPGARLGIQRLHLPCLRQVVYCRDLHQLSSPPTPLRASAPPPMGS